MAPFLDPTCANNTGCSPPVTAFDIQQGILAALSGSPDFPLIFEVLGLALEGNASPFASSGPPSLGNVVAMPLLANDYGKSPDSSII